MVGDSGAVPAAVSPLLSLFEIFATVRHLWMGRLKKQDKPEELPESCERFFAFGEKAGNDSSKNQKIIFYLIESGLR